jgi:hypothetical protein
MYLDYFSYETVPEEAYLILSHSVPDESEERGYRFVGNPLVLSADTSLQFNAFTVKQFVLEKILTR